MLIEFDEYEAQNLRFFLRWARFIADTGDWYGQILHKLPIPPSDFQPTGQDLDDRLAFHVLEKLRKKR